MLLLPLPPQRTDVRLAATCGIAKTYRRNGRLCRTCLLWLIQPSPNRIRKFGGSQHISSNAIHPSQTLNWCKSKNVHKLFSLWLTTPQLWFLASLEPIVHAATSRWRLAGIHRQKSHLPRIPSRPLPSCSATWPHISPRDTAPSPSPSGSGSPSYRRLLRRPAKRIIPCPCAFRWIIGR